MLTSSLITDIHILYPLFSPYQSGHSFTNHTDFLKEPDFHFIDFSTVFLLSI